MYETEVNRQVEQAHDVPVDVRKAFNTSGLRIISRTVLPWGEHCTECVYPTCYKTCDMYEPRNDGKCRRFTDGMVRIEGIESPSGHIIRIRFKRWAKLWTVGNTRLFPVAQARAIEQDDLEISRAIANRTDPSSLGSRIVERYQEKKAWALQSSSAGCDEPDYFLLECYNPGPAQVTLTLTLRRLKSLTRIPFQRNVEVQSGFNRCAVPFSEVAGTLDTHQPFEVEITPNGDRSDLTLYFGLLDFVRERRPAEAAHPCKVVIWDLDNTIWDGTLAEDGIDKVRLKEGIRDVIAELDRRGILMSVASKNDAEEARSALRRLRLERYFMYPQFSWQPKSQSVAQIAAHLNVGIDSMIFIDDSAFERAEVQSRCPGISTLDATLYKCILQFPEVQSSATEESRNRRRLYELQQTREKAEAAFDGEYREFLRGSSIQMSVRRLSKAGIERAYELTQRTQQLNFSGNQYTREELEAMVRGGACAAFLIEVTDRYGDYGTVGFCAVDYDSSLISDLVFSCRIKGKRAEHAFLSSLVRQFRATGGSDLYLRCKPTPRNAHAVEALGEVGFKEVSHTEGVSLYIFRASQCVRDEGIITVTGLGRPDSTPCP